MGNSQFFSASCPSHRNFSDKSMLIQEPWRHSQASNQSRQYGPTWWGEGRGSSCSSSAHLLKIGIPGPSCSHKVFLPLTTFGEPLLWRRGSFLTEGGHHIQRCSAVHRSSSVFSKNDYNSRKNSKLLIGGRRHASTLLAQNKRLDPSFVVGALSYLSCISLSGRFTFFFTQNKVNFRFLSQVAGFRTMNSLGPQNHVLWLYRNFTMPCFHFWKTSQIFVTIFHIAFIAGDLNTIAE